MRTFVVRYFLLGAAFLLWSASLAQAQFQLRIGANPAAFNAGVAGANANLAALGGFASMSSVNAAANDAALLGAGSLSPFLDGSTPGLVNLGVANMGNLYGSSTVIQ